MKKILFIIFIISFIQLKPQPPGLANCGNTCFLNASIQALYNINPLTNILTANPNPYSSSTRSLSYLYTELIKEFEKENRPHIFSCDTVLGELDKEAPEKIPGFKCGAQEDATEFFFYLLNDLLANTALQRSIRVLFKLYLKPIIECPAIEGFSASTKGLPPESDLSIKVEVIDDEIPLTSLMACLESFFKKEKFSDPQDPYRDTFTNKNRLDCTKQFKLLNSPEILQITLKRYQYISSTQTQKLTHKIDIPLKINISEFLFTRPKDPENKHYELIGVIIQGGTAKGGHYWAYVKTNEQWYKCNDSVITPVNISRENIPNDITGSATEGTGYLFIYQKTTITRSEYELWQKLEKERKRKEAEQIAFKALSNELEKLTGSLRSLTNLLK
ncbi:MAG: ubiquitin carboxyl-terminal hydrolase family protein [Candidatus Babeliales bacterium]